MDTFEVFGIIIISIFTLFLLSIAPLAYYSSCRVSEIYNEQNQTHYTCGDFFWAGSQINGQTQTIKLEN